MWIGWDTDPPPFRYTGWGTGPPVEAGPPVDRTTGDQAVWALDQEPGGGGGRLAYWMVDTVRSGDIVQFDRPGSRFYDEFPRGRRVAPSEAFVDTQLHKRVLAVRETWGTAEAPRRDLRRSRRGGPPPPEHIVTTVKIRSENATMLWTTFAKGRFQLMSVIVTVVEV